MKDSEPELEWLTVRSKVTMESHPSALVSVNVGNVVEDA